MAQTARSNILNDSIQKIYDRREALSIQNDSKQFYLISNYIPAMKESKMKSSLKRQKLTRHTIKFKTLPRESSNESQALLASSSSGDFLKLSQKISATQSLKASNRGFQKSLYKKLQSRIEEKPLSFYAYGLKSEEKKACKRVFKDLFDVPGKKLEGTIGVADLWSNAVSIRYLKENQMFWNKELIVKEFKEMGKKIDLQKKDLRKKNEQEALQKCREMMVGHRLRKRSHVRYSSMHDIEPASVCRKIKADIDAIIGSRRPDRGRSQSRKLIQELQLNSEAMEGLESRFKKEMILLV